MDLGTVIIGTLGFAACAIPFIITTRIKKKKEKELVTLLKKKAKEYNAEITQHEICGDYIIGIDAPKKQVYFILKTEDNFKEQYINLSSIKSCRIDKVTSKTNEIEFLNLVFNPIVKNKPIIMLEFYNAQVNYQISGEYESIEKWNDLITKILNNK